MQGVARFLALLLCIATPASASWHSVLQISVGSAAYVGPGDLFSFSVWGGLRAYSAATRGNAVINVCNVSDVACVDMSSDAVTGALVVTTVGGSACSVVTCTIKTVYDQTGNGFFVTQPTIATRPTLVVSCQGGKPCMRFGGTSTILLSVSGPTIAQPFLISAVATRTTVSSYAGIFGSPGALLYFNNAANQAILYAGGVSGAATASDNNWHNMNGIFNGSSSAYVIDTAITSSLNPGTTSFNGGLTVGADSTASLTLTGSVEEFGVLSGLYTTTQANTINANQHTFWGTGL